MDVLEAAHASFGGPVPTAVAYLEALAEGSYEEAWAMLDDGYRLALVQAWLMANAADVNDPRWPQVADDLAEQGPGHELWAAFAASDLAARAEQYDRWWGILSRPRLLGPDLEQVVFATGGRPRVLQDGDSVLAWHFVLRHTDDGWRIAGCGDLAEPGWPPRV